MFKHLLVPLDGSPLAESALPLAVYMADICHARVTLLHVIEHDAPPEVHGTHHVHTPAEAQSYLATIRDRAFPSDQAVAIHVHSAEVKDVARSIAAHVAELAPDLIVMCTHGRGGPRRWLFSSKAQQVIALGSTPVLLVPAASAEPLGQFICRHIVVPLDGQPDHERGLQVAAALAGINGAALHLVLVIPTFEALKAEQAATGKFLPHTMTTLLEMSQESAEEYLRGQVEALHTTGLTVTAEIARGEAVVAILQAAQRTRTHMIVLATHGKTGLDAFWSGSLTPQLLERSAAPVLLVRVS